MYIEASILTSFNALSLLQSFDPPQALLKTGTVPLLGKLLATDNVDVLIPVVGTLQECASEVRSSKVHVIGLKQPHVQQLVNHECNVSDIDLSYM